ncbi:hypothetical protein MLD38_015936 [Melastoma candidum]|uniref:Uncharacterized protein n=1 Tax=Melastoma candidum TaxID=119954 RepID=A0ACB9RIZ1_9MYRT|nr:hypothetical protein MLD38_015936 [Melastoma candidum]
MSSRKPEEGCPLARSSQAAARVMPQVGFRPREMSLEATMVTPMLSPNLLSPPSLPIIGHLHLIGPVASESFWKLSLRYGPSSAPDWRLFLCRCLQCCGCPGHIPEPGPQLLLEASWRILKKLCMTQPFGTSQLERSSDVRAEEVRRLVELIPGRAADLGRELTRTCLILAGKLSRGNILGPWPRKLDCSSNGRKLVSTLMKYDHLIEKIMEEHEQRNAADGSGAAERKKDLMDILLETHKDPSVEVRISRNDVKSFLLDLLLAGMESTSTAMQWAMAELINNSGMFKKLRDEIISTVGIDRLVNESDLPKLPYLRAVIMETLRLSIHRRH